jgi:hypothetical protein
MKMYFKEMEFEGVGWIRLTQNRDQCGFTWTR